jgi:hypothetical protein
MGLGFSSLLIVVMFACTRDNDYRVSTHLTAQQQEEMMGKIIRYAARAPEGLTFEKRFYPPYDTFYQRQASLHKLDAWYLKRDTHYFLISRRAPSLVEKRVATGGKLVLTPDGKIEYYEEVFRTWKMTPDTLARRSLFLFDKMVKGESLTPYETRNASGVEYIEFPDERTYFDKGTRQWKVKSN